MASIAAFLTALGLVFPGWPAVLVANTPPGSASTPVTQIFIGGSTSINTGAAVEYGFPASISTVDLGTLTESQASAIMLDGTISELRVVMSANCGTGGDSCTFSLRKNASATGQLTCNATGADLNCDDLVTSLAFSDGDLLSMEVTTASSPAAVIPTWSFKWVGTNSNESMIVSSYNANSTTNTLCGSGSGSQLVSGSCTTTIIQKAVPAAENFTITKLYARAGTAFPDETPDQARVLTLFKNGSADSGCQVTISDAAQAANDVTCSTSYSTSATPDTLSIEDDPDANTPPNGIIAFTYGVTQTSQRFQQSVCGTDAPAIAATEFQKPTGGGTTTAWNATETAVDAIVDGFTQTGFAFVGDVAPGTASNVVYTFRDDTANAIGCTVTDPALTCNGSGSTAVVDASLVDISSVATAVSTPAAWCLSWSGTGS